MKLIEQIVEVFSEHRGAMHVNDIANAIIRKYPNTSIAPDILANKVSAVLAADIKKNKGKSLFSKPKNKSGAIGGGYIDLRSLEHPQENLRFQSSQKLVLNLRVRQESTR